MRLSVLAIGVICAASDAAAGAWAREDGTLFVAAGGLFALSADTDQPVVADPTLYAEYGLTPAITVGLNFYTSDGATYAGQVFARIPVGAADGADRYAVSLGFGMQGNFEVGFEGTMQAGYAYGRGLQNGWLALDAFATIGTNDKELRGKADFTWGQHVTDKWRTMVQLQTGQGDTGDLYARISPGVIYQWSDQIQVYLGAVHGVTGGRETQIKLETWFEF